MTKTHENANASSESTPREQDGRADYSLNCATAIGPEGPSVLLERAPSKAQGNGHLGEVARGAASTQDNASLVLALSRVVAATAQKAVEEAFNLGRLQSTGSVLTGGPRGDGPPTGEQ